MFYKKELIETIIYLLELPEDKYQEYKKEVDNLGTRTRNLYKKVFEEVDKRREKYKGAK